ncbi:MAG TPA: 3-phosphoshikimate 1-carboxyvinyltransferase [Anaerohalosphaeraceae bacterium]|jgi:3-phosphoshikimate 1-carboxyvinyltransferase|nr:3-phosphoshikimate 1-carboxyvinyltransferase [Anaerohalosphaeraceae bacterium]HRT49367.1 3-phosphoshikimate 1-carboxyvinyltransferase [Anaerohalosphaeraceae bacterium]HRT85904.1 3-phosphoshikimate 1-carboxyvinyltransferase [Anaerohalosphaeraceae bacterium]
MKLNVRKSRLRGTVAMPGSKSHTIRGVAVASLAEGTSILHRPLTSGDTLSAVACYSAMGARIDTSDPAAWKITGVAGRIRRPGGIIDVGNSGTTLRLAMSSAALCREPGATEFTGDEQIRSRPVGPLLASLNDLGAHAESIHGRAPVRISGALKGGKTAIKCLTSQYLSSLLLAAPLAENDTEIEVTLLNEPDYVQMTLDWLDKQQIVYRNDGMRHFTVQGNQKYTAFDLPIPADFSSATFFLCAAAMLDADVTLTGLDFSDSQPDKAVAEYLRRMGADVTITNNAVRIRGDRLHGAEIDMNRTPDALPALAVTAAFADGQTRLVNVPQARSKETDRIACMAQELTKLGAAVEELDDGLIINPRPLQSTWLNGRGDHRIVMALSLAGMALPGATVIDTAEAMNVTFPDYVSLMTSLGAQMEIEG